MSDYKIVWTCKLVHKLPVGQILLNANLPSGSGATPEEALAGLHAQMDARVEALDAQQNVVPRAAA